MKTIDRFEVTRISDEGSGASDKVNAEEEEDDLTSCLLDSIGYPEGVKFVVRFLGRIEMP